MPSCIKITVSKKYSTSEIHVASIIKFVPQSHLNIDIFHFLVELKKSSSEVIMLDHTRERVREVIVKIFVSPVW